MLLIIINTGNIIICNTMQKTRVAFQSILCSSFCENTYCSLEIPWIDWIK